jgi:toxin FitB
MIILDTNVISEPMKAHANKAVLTWLDLQAVESLFVTSTSLAELFVGLALLPEDKRKFGLVNQLDDLISRLFSTRILAFDRASAINYAQLVSRASLSGSAISMGDGQIAAIAQTHGFTVATRDTQPFIAAGLPVINPWEF